MCLYGHGEAVRVVWRSSDDRREPQRCLFTEERKALIDCCLFIAFLVLVPAHPKLQQVVASIHRPEPARHRDGCTGRHPRPRRQPVGHLGGFRSQPGGGPKGELFFSLLFFLLCSNVLSSLMFERSSICLSHPPPLLLLPRPACHRGGWRLHLIYRTSHLVAE